jgi:hypothetical protein
MISAMFCPHCDGALPATWARQQPGRCPTCRLVVGAGRATDQQGDGITLSGAGTAAGILGAAARRESAPAGDRLVVAQALREAARTLDKEVPRLRMLDYQHAADSNPALPGLGVVLSTFGTWKLARLHAGDRTPSAAATDAADERRHSAA